jgi:hypothetical protein
MRLWVPGNPATLPAMDELIEAAATKGHEPREGVGLSLRLRFVYKLPEGPLAVRPTLPDSPVLPELAYDWAFALVGFAYRDAGQIVQVYARREWGNAEGVEVSL